VESGLRHDLGTALARNRYILFLALLVASVFLAYSPTFTNGFVYDDVHLIQQNPLVTEHRWLEIWRQDLWADTGRWMVSSYYRPLVASCFALEFLVYGENSAGYHLDNLILHCVAMILLFLVANDVFARKKRAALAAFLAAAFYALHPANTQVVYWISARGELLVAIGILLGMYSVKRDGPLALLAMPVSAFLALFSKETGVLYFVLVPLYYYSFHARGRGLRRIALRLSSLIPVLVLYFVLRFQAVPPSLPPTSDSSFWTASDGVHTRLLTVPSIWGYYLLRALFPFFLNFETGIRLFDSPWNWQFLAGTLSVVLTAFLVVRFRRGRVFRWAFLFWLLSLLPVLNIFVAMFESGMEHYLYLPLIALAILVAYTLPTNRVSTSLAVLVFASFAVTVFLRGSVWRDEITLWSDAVSKTNVGCRQGWIRSRVNLANAFCRLPLEGAEERETLDAAEELYREVADRHPEYGYAWRGLGEVSLRRKRFEEAETRFRKAIEHRPQDYRIWTRLGGALLAQGKRMEAREVCERAIAIEPGYPPAVMTLTTIHMLEGDYKEADEVLGRVDRAWFDVFPFATALEVAIDVARGRQVVSDSTELGRIALALDGAGLYADEARVLEILFERGIDADALYRLAMIKIVQLNEEEQGTYYLREGLERFPDDVRFMRSMAVAYERRNEKEKAAELLERVLQLFPNHPDAAAIESHVTRLRADR
jgi:Flp pilus assembly protein TadD